MAISNTRFEYLYRYFNSERREVQGNTYFGPDAEFEGAPFEEGVRMRSTQLFYLDMSQIGVEKEIVIQSLANDVNLCLRYKRVEDVGGNVYFKSVQFYRDKNGDYIDFGAYDPELRGITGSPEDLDDESAYQFQPDSDGRYRYYVSSPGFSYTGETGASANTFVYMGNSYIYAPGITGTSALVGDINNDYLLDYFKIPSYSKDTINTDALYDSFFDIIENAGDGTPITPILPSEDTSKPDGGDEDWPDYNPLSDPVPFPGLPTGGDSISTGMIRVYNPTVAQLQSLAGVLWSDNFVETIKKVQNDPFEAIISLHSVPFGLVGSASTCKIGNFNTQISMSAITTQFFTLNLGSIYIPEHWASALDYSPYVTIDCFIPFVGVVKMQVDDIVGRTVQIKMNVDVLSGAALVSVMCGESVLYTYNTNVIFRHPISQSSYGPLYQSVLSMVGSIASGASSGGVGGAVGGAIGGALNVAMSKHSEINRGGSIGIALLSYAPVL